MKYKFNAFIASAIFLSSLTFALATSGACSGHGGVECSAGPDSDGSVICVDGWRNSSVSYASMVKCQGYNAVQQEAPMPAVVRPEPVPVTTSAPLPIEKKAVAKPVEKKAKPVTAKASSTPQKIKVATSTATTTAVIETKPAEPKALSTMPTVAKESGVKSLLKRLKFWQ